MLGHATALARSVLSGVTHKVALERTTLRTSTIYTDQTKHKHTREADSSCDEVGWVKRRAQIAHELRESGTKSPQRPAHAQPLPHTQRVELVAVKIAITHQAATPREFCSRHDRVAAPSTA